MKNRFRILNSLSVLLALTFGSSLSIDAAQQPQTAPAAPTERFAIELAPSGLPSKAAPESVLPAGAILHVRINAAGPLLDDASAMLTPFLPEKALGRPAMMALEQPNPLLALIGLRTMGQFMSVEMLSQISGIDPARPITLSFYLDDPSKGFALFVPVLDLQRPSALLQNMFPQTEPPEKIALDGGSALRLPAEDIELFVVCSEDAICLCGSAFIAQNVIANQPNQKLNQSKLIADAVKQHAADNLLIAIDATPVKPLLPAIESFRQIPPQKIAQLRSDLLSQFGESELEAFNRQLNAQTGIRDLEQLLDYVESIATGSYEVTFEGLSSVAKDFHGIILAVDLAEEFQSFEIGVVSDTIQAAKSTKPIDLNSVKQVLTALPGPHDFLVINGRAPQPERSTFLAALAKRIGAKMDEKDLPMNVYERVSAAIDEYTPVVPLESQVDWTIGTRFFVGSVAAENYQDIWTYLSDAWQNFALVTLQAIPPQKKGFLESHFEQKSTSTNANYASLRKLMIDLNAGDSFLSQYANAKAETLDGDVHKLTYEDCYRTSSGLFGYNEHELINRYFTLYRIADDHTLLWPGGNNVTMFQSFKSQPQAPAIDRLLAAAEISGNVQQIEIWRNIHGILDFVDAVDGVESLLHKELSAYLESIQQIVAKHGTEDIDEIVPELESIPMPISVAHVQLDRSTNQVYLVTPAGLTFPRPAISPAIKALFADYRAASSKVGGAIVHHTTVDGRYDVVVKQSTAGMSQLIRTVGNNIADQYLNNPAGQQQLQQLFSTELDLQSSEGVRLYTNNNWSFLD